MHRSCKFCPGTKLLLKYMNLHYIWLKGLLLELLNQTGFFIRKKALNSVSDGSRSCLLYDNYNMSMSLLALCSGMKLVSLAFYALAVLASKRSVIGEDKIDNEDIHQVAMEKPVRGETTFPARKQSSPSFSSPERNESMSPGHTAVIRAVWSHKTSLTDIHTRILYG